MASDGGSIFPFVVDDISKTQVHDPGMSLRDGFAMALATVGQYSTDPNAPRSCIPERDIYDFAQMLTDEKLRRDKADRIQGPVMATAPKLWAFRYTLAQDGGDGRYVLWRGQKPRKSRRGGWPNVQAHETFEEVRTNWLLRGRDFEAIFPIRLEPGGGPVEIRFADDE